MRSKFETEGIDLICKLLQNKKIEYTITEDQFNDVDIITSKCHIEVKNRKIESHRYKNDGFYLQYDKYIKLLNNENKTYYINTFIWDDHSIIYIFDIKNLKDIEWTEEWMNKTNEFGRKNKVLKKVAKLTKKDIKNVYIYNNNVFKKTEW